MNELIKVTYHDETPMVSARELHKMLEVKTAYKDWFPRMCEYGFTDGIEFNSLKIEQVQMEGDREVTRMISNALLTIDMAKEICMLQRTEKAKQIRRYFIQIEKDWNSPEKVMARALQIANRKIEQLKSENVKLLEVQEYNRPLVEFAEHVSESVNSIDVGTFSKILYDENIHIGRNRLFDWFKKNKYLMKDTKPYQQYVDAGYFEVIEQTFKTPYGEKRVWTKTLITGKGQIYFTEKLRKENLTK